MVGRSRPLPRLWKVRKEPSLHPSLLLAGKALTRTLLIDADILAYRSSSANQRSYDWGDGVKSTAADMGAAKRYAETEIVRYADKLKADEVLICLSDDFDSFRKDRIWKGYKEFRADTERPVHLYDMKAWLREEYDVAWQPTLEADDVMGIIQTDPSRTDETIILSADKDMMTVPGKLYRPQQPQLGVLEISPLEAIRFHFWQALVGDTTDGYPGAPGIGPKSPYAEAVLEAEDEVEAWDIVLAAYGTKGLTEEHALVQARLAHILHHGEWDGRSVKLWVPPAWEEPVDED